MSVCSPCLQRTRPKHCTRLLHTLSHVVRKATINIKQQQREAIQCDYNRKDAFSQLATNWLWQVALLRGLAHVIDYKLGTDCSMVLVISPLGLLMIDQVWSLYARGVPAAILRSNIFGYLSILYTPVPMTDTSDMFSRITHMCKIISGCAYNVYQALFFTPLPPKVQ